MTTNKNSSGNATLLLILLAVFATLGCANNSTKTEVEKRHLMAATTNQFDFSKDLKFNFFKSLSSLDNTFHVTSSSIYTDDRGYGFDLDTHLQEKSPFYFSIQVPEGNYRVTIEFGHPYKPSSNTVKAELRRLYLQDLTTTAGKFITRDFIVNIRNGSLTPPEENAPGGARVLLKEYEQHRLHWDNKLTLEFNGSAPQVRSITLQKVEVPTVFLVGDSTVTDQPYEPAASWGQMFPYFFDDTIAIANHAESGETMKSFISSLRFAKVLEKIKHGDYLLIQFGHNDQKKHWPQTYVEAETTYRDYLKVFIAEARLRGATPILITSMQRRTFDKNGKIVNSHGQYPQAVRDVATAMNTALIDLDSMSIKLYEALGVQDAPKAFNDGGKDATHHNNYGAYQLAQCVVQAIRDAQLPLASHLRPHLSNYNPAAPDNVNTFHLSPSPQTSNIRPAGN